MNYSDINTIILVDDRNSTYQGGGYGSPERKNRYAILFAVFKDRLEKLNEAYLVLGNGTFSFDFEDYELKEYDRTQMFSGNGNAQQIFEKIEKLADGKNTLLLIDYTLNNSTEKKEEGKRLAREILKSVEHLDNVIRFLYSTMPENKTESKEFNWAYLFDFPIESPTDAADEILQALEKRGDLCV